MRGKVRTGRDGWWNGILGGLVNFWSARETVEEEVDEDIEMLPKYTKRPSIVSLPD